MAKLNNATSFAMQMSRAAAYARNSQTINRVYLPLGEEFSGNSTSGGNGGSAVDYILNTCIYTM